MLMLGIRIESLLSQDSNSLSKKPPKSPLFDQQMDYVVNKLYISLTEKHNGKHEFHASHCVWEF